MQVPTSAAPVERRSSPSARQWITSVAPVAAWGGIMGLAAKHFDNAPVIGEIGTYLGVWVFAASLIAAFSRTPLHAAVLVPLFFVAMLAAYYLYSMRLFAFFPRREFLYWGGIAAASPAGAWIVWHGRGKGWIAALCASLPVALLLLKVILYITRDAQRLRLTSSRRLCCSFCWHGLPGRCSTPAPGQRWPSW